MLELSDVPEELTKETLENLINEYITNTKKCIESHFEKPFAD